MEAKFALEKWNKIAESMEAAGSQKYSSLFIQKKLKELEKKGDTGKAGIAVSGHGTAEED